MSLIPDNSWYALASGSDLQQGDILQSCKVITVEADQLLAISDEQKAIASLKTYDVIILNQSCDLEQNKLEALLVCPVFSLAVASASRIDFMRPKVLEKIRRGFEPALFMLAAPSLPSFPSEIHIVQFRQLYVLPFDYATNLAKSQSPRLRLLPPYREHLSQAFARFMMRVALPTDIPKFN